MMELTTGVVFLMSSLYGAGSANAQTAATSSANVMQDNPIVALSSSTDPKVIQAYVQAQFADEPILVDVARCESTFRQFNPDGSVVRGRVDQDDVGVMQINEEYQGPTAKKLGYDIYTIEGNVAYAKYLYQKQGTAPWSSSEPCWSSSLALAKKN